MPGISEAISPGPETKLTNEFVRAFDGHEKIKMTKAAEKLTEFGEKQNDVNEALAGNINSLIKRVCALEDKQEKNTEIMKKIATELAAFKRELDRVRLTEKLNSGAIERLSNAMSLAAAPAEESSGENGEE